MTRFVQSEDRIQGVLWLDKYVSELGLRPNPRRRATVFCILSLKVSCFET